MVTRSVLALGCFIAHRDDEGEVGADDEVGNGEHVDCRQFDKLYRFDEAL